MKEKKIVSIVLFGEKLPKDLIENHLRNILSQTYENKEVIIFYDSDREDDFEDLITKYSFQNCNFIKTENLIESCFNIKNIAKGDIVFFKTGNPIEWLPRHIEVHLEKYNKVNTNWIQSLIEIRDSANPNGAMNIIQWRLQPPTGDEFELDEISIKRDINIDWNKVFDEKKFFHKKKLIIQLGNGNLSDEISTIKWVNSNIQQKNQIAAQLGKPNEQNFCKEGHFPTILGNIFQHIRNQEIYKQIENIDSNSIESIIIKRLAGMGDVIMTEPIKRYLKNKYPNAKISLMTANSRGSSDAAKILGYDEVICVEENNLTNDSLMSIITKEDLVDGEDGTLEVQEIEVYNYNNYQLKFDLDLSYESRHKPYLMSYFELINVKWEDVKDEYRFYQFTMPDEVKAHILANPIRNPLKKKIYLHREGSGWPGKTYPNEKWDIIKQNFIEQGFDVTEGHNFEDYNELLKTLSEHSYYMGTDSGIMHLSLGLGLKCFSVNGAALSQFTALPYVESGQLISVQASFEELPCLGCKHKQFFNIVNIQGRDQLTFVANCINQRGPICMSALEPKDITKIYLENL